MTFHRVLLALASLLLALACTSGASAQIVVTACGTDDATGGVNFNTATHAGVDIVIRCASGAGIRLTHTHTLSRGVTIESEAMVTLAGPGEGPMFSLPNGGRLIFRNLTLTNPPSAPSNPAQYTGVILGLDERVSVELSGVEVNDTRLPFVVESLRARDSSFSRNGTASEGNLGVVMASQIDLAGVSFVDNLSRPFQSVGDGELGFDQFRAQVKESIFTGNRRPAMWQGGSFLLENCRFEGNGDGALFADHGGIYELPGHVSSIGLNDEAGPSFAGALELRWTQGTIDSSTFLNNTGVIGGALLVMHAQVRVQSSSFDGNHAGAGGAIAAIRVKFGDQEFLPTGLDLVDVTLRDNEASHDGGAMLLSGEVSGTGIIVTGNRAGSVGGAISWIGPSLAVPESITAAYYSELVELPDVGKGALVLRRAFVLDNRSAGATLDGQLAELHLGNLLAARNETPPGSATISGASVGLANSTIIGNKAGGLLLTPGGSGGRLVNTIIADNGGRNCEGQLIVADAGNLQSPDTDCGTAVPVATPALDRRFGPGWTSPARNSGDPATCATNPLVEGLDIYGDPRGETSCSSGAVEANLVREAAAALPPGMLAPQALGWLLVALLLFLLLCVVLGLVCGARRRYR